MPWMKIVPCGGGAPRCFASNVGLKQTFYHVGTDETALIEILATRSNAQRVEIRKRYKTMFGKDLMNDLKSELSGNLEECLLAMMEPSVLYDAKCLRRAMRVGILLQLPSVIILHLLFLWCRILLFLTIPCLGS